MSLDRFRRACVIGPFVAGLLLLSTACSDGSLTVRQIDGADPSDPTDPTPGVDPDDPTLPDPSGNNSLGNSDPSTPPPIEAGRVTLRRLNRAEYNNTVRDLLGVDSAPADAFPPDNFGYGFNNVGEAMSVSPLLFEFYEITAGNLIDQVLERPVKSTKQYFEAESIGSSVGAASGGFWNLWSNGSLQTRADFPASGDYIIRVRAGAQQAGPDPARMAIELGAVELTMFDVTNDRADPMVFEHTARIDEGQHFVSVSFTNDYYDRDNGADRNLYVDWIEIEGPVSGVVESNPLRERIMICSPEDTAPEACARQIFEAFATRAWRRPASSAEVDALVNFIGVAASEGGSFEDGIRLGLKATLLSPHFIFKPESDQAPVGQPHRLTQYELATRLSYFLWSSMPDQELTDLAAQGRLDDDEVLRQQVTRMLADERATALVDNFATQWLYIDQILDVSPDYELYPDFDDALRVSMRLETRRFIQDFIFEDQDLRDILLAKYSYINERLATHYGIPGVQGDELQRVEFTGEGRRGLLTHGGLLTARSYPNRTSPVLRGVWVLEQVLCDEPPPPPADVESIDDQMAGDDLTLRERLELHRSKPQCIGCHATMDPIGFGLEHYDPTGAWRDTDNGKMVDALGELPDGRTFNGAFEMADILANDPKYTHCVTEKMLTYALGRGVHARDEESADRPQVDAIVHAVEAANYSSRELIVQIVLSDAFRLRTPEPQESEE